MDLSTWMLLLVAVDTYLEKFRSNPKMAEYVKQMEDLRVRMVNEKDPSNW
jgi:hypothetical protein